ncbi:hypothetical protein [Mucilaginibacter sp.]|uniref:hypothetical protein n=1 Tax=Mucilaginibacter sp. TaxID=1882438 RepID=UPI003266DAB1
MELDDFKSAWKSVEFPMKGDREILSMIRESKHPVLKKIRRQLTIEVAGLTVFLACYWSLFDGASKHFFVNLLLVITLLATIWYNIYGYYIAKNIVDGPNLQASFQKYLRRMSGYALGSIFSKAFYAFSLIVFFTSGVSFHLSTYFALGTIAILFTIQLTLLSRMWAKRLGVLNELLSLLK